MSRRVLCMLLAGLAAPGMVHAAVSCPDRVPAPVTSVASGSRTCQERIAIEGGKFLRKKMALLSACKLSQPTGTCPRTQEQDKITTAALNARAKIAADCGADAAQAGLTSSYNTGTDDTVISSCMLSQHSVAAEYVIANAMGVSTESWPGAPVAERKKCLREVATRGRLFAAKAVQASVACIKTQMKNGVLGDLAPICIGSFAGGVFVPPTHTPTANALLNLFAKAEQKIAEKCGPLATFGQLQTIFACPGATTIADFQECIACTGWSSALDVLAQQYSEAGEFVSPGAGALQAAVTAASPGDKLLIGEGTYPEEVLIAQSNLSLVGCGAATGDRPVIPAIPAGTGRGIQANAQSNLVFQSLELNGQSNDGIRITNSNGLTFRDIVGDGMLQSAYSIFPQTSNNVLIELCKVKNCDDAPLYVGQSSTIVVRYNDVRNSVAAIEIENCGNAEVYGNYATDNTGALLLFKDGSLPVQLSECHHVHHNLFENNNTPNFGSGSVAQVPDGSGILVISTDSTPIHHNVARGNDSFGFALTDQAFSMFGPPFSADQDPEDIYIYDNYVTGNGLATDIDPPLAGDFLAVALSDLPALGNCQSGNLYDTQIGLEDLPPCTLPPPAFAGCPAPPVP